MQKITILIHCKDRPNIIASVTNFIAQKDGNIVYIDQHVDREQNIFFMRLESEFVKESFSADAFRDAFKTSLADEFSMKWRIYLQYSLSNVYNSFDDHGGVDEHYTQYPN